MELIDLLLTCLFAPALLCGLALGIGGAFLLHWLALSPEPLGAEALLVALGFIGGLLCTLWLNRDERHTRRY